MLMILFLLLIVRKNLKLNNFYMTNQVKSTLKSKTIWGAGVAAVATLLQLFGIVDITAAEQQTIVGSITGAAQLIGSCIAIWGRLSAKHTLSFFKS